MTEIVKRIFAGLTKKLLLVGAVLTTWLLSIVLPEGVTLGVAQMILSLNSGYAERIKWLRAYWTGENPK
jgi:hypothetical protein